EPEPQAAAEPPAEPEPQAAAEPPAEPEPQAAAEPPAEAAPEAPPPVAADAAEAVAAEGEEPAAAKPAKAKAKGKGKGKGKRRGPRDEPPVPMTPEMVALQGAMEEKQSVEGQVIGWNKGGYHVAIGRIAAFCPVSQIEIGNPRSPKRYLDGTFHFHVIEIQRGGRRVVLSRASALKSEREERASEVRARLKPGEELEGKISSITNFGAFVDLGGGIEGLVHVSEISRKRVEHPKEVLKVGQQVKVMVLKIEKGGQRISLSMKRLEADPWEGIADRYTPGEKFQGKILRKTDFGLFVELEPGLEGLAHSSRLPWGVDLSDESLDVGHTVEGWIHEVEAKRRRLSLSLRELGRGGPWQGIEDRFPVGGVVKGTVDRVTNFGVFIELEPGLTGLLPFSNLSMSPGANPRRQYHNGKEVSIRVLSIDREKRRISLGTESSKAEGSNVDYREYKQQQQTRTESSGLNAMAAAFEKLRSQQQQ
ncbi:MAG: S1 RNA-binding domain-containing protein, partial [bacterium]|nr:S1 RNA-binding domain-containing protein [bacterium]